MHTLNERFGRGESMSIYIKLPGLQSLMGKFTPVHQFAMNDAPVDEMNASLQRERGKGMHHVSKSIYLRQIKLTDSCSASHNLSEKRIHIFQCETSVQV